MVSGLVWASLHDGLPCLVTPAQLVPSRRELGAGFWWRLHLELQSINGIKEVCRAHAFICGALVEVVTADLLYVVTMWSRCDGSMVPSAPEETSSYCVIQPEFD